MILYIYFYKRQKSARHQVISHIVPTTISRVRETCNKMETLVNSLVNQRDIRESKEGLFREGTYLSLNGFGAVVRSVTAGGRFYTGMPWYPVARPSSQAARARCSPDVPLSLRWISPRFPQLPPSFPPGLRCAVLVLHISSAWADSWPMRTFVFTVRAKDIPWPITVFP